MAHARVVLTDSGGIQEETTILGVPCLTLRENTERPVTVELGTNRLVGQQPERILAAYREVRAAAARSGRIPPLWDGGAAAAHRRRAARARCRVRGAGATPAYRVDQATRAQIAGAL